MKPYKTKIHSRQRQLLLGIYLTMMTAGVIQAGILATSAHNYKGLLLNPTKVIQPYTLTSHNGKQIDFPTANGNFQLIFFGYTSCPDVCPTTLLKIKQVIRSFANESRVNYNFVSIDVERDKPGQLKEFVTYFDPRITGYTGSIHNIKGVEKEFGILTRKFQGSTALAYKLEHSVFMYLVDPEGKLMLMYPGSTDAQHIISDLKLVLYGKQEAKN